MAIDRIFKIKVEGGGVRVQLSSDSEFATIAGKGANQVMALKIDDLESLATAAKKAFDEFVEASNE